MAAISANQWSSDLKRFYQQIIARSKPPKVALTAVARKLIVLANTPVADDRT
jgi:transposase